MKIKYLASLAILIEITARTNTVIIRLGDTNEYSRKVVATAERFANKGEETVFKKSAPVFEEFSEDPEEGVPMSVNGLGMELALGQVGVSIS